ncbi:uridine diphosphate-N-acetylglucosamine-binding protein YvcK [Catenovulum sp. 2E275]|uniref:gluconeogenesis factor YvcK family protein n=1 Tax=Catenovulum sp. 2E275 TaxID=2980497 RepID=UPI0021CE288F|nr:uridine diphosphate-N-acetylglucosamine-binding protein YvcK [Catenovulum sp. 2E275]MCU4674622.1 uridine diphosphate-N-acetylglucosamine-binding protein YvcK [Catenovulum sp. 2E275]
MQLRQINLVAIGGGHGLGKVLNTFSELGSNLTGIVATTDNGGSTGKLRQNQDSIAWGDLRNCIAHLSKSQLGTDLLNYRFSQGELDQHCLGNLIFFAMQQLDVSPVGVVEIVRRLLKIDSKLYPMTEEPTDLIAHYAEQLIHGEITIDQQNSMPDKLSLANKVVAPNKVLRAIQNANVILLGPGSFLTSVMPALLVKDIAQALAQTQAKIIFIDNLAAEHGPCHNTSLQDRLNWLANSNPQIKISGVLSGLDTPKVNLDGCIHLQKSLNASDVYYRHDEHKLKHAITELICKLF